MYIDVYFLLTDGKLPTEEDCAGMEAYLSEEDIRPLGDKVSAKAPGMAQYRIDFRYYINRSDSNKAASIQNSVNNAVNEYIAWQHRLGIDINPSELIRKVVAAGAKRIEVTEPAYQKVEDTEVAVIDSISVTYEGLEDD
jgi:phage-related baseplate assembly protein